MFHLTHTFRWAPMYGPPPPLGDYKPFRNPCYRLSCSSRLPRLEFLTSTFLRRERRSLFLDLSSFSVFFFVFFGPLHAVVL